MAAVLDGGGATVTAAGAGSLGEDEHRPRDGPLRVSDFILFAGSDCVEDSDDATDEEPGIQEAGVQDATHGADASGEALARRRRSVEARERNSELICPICEEVMYRPVRTQCNHSFCLPCLLLWLEEGASQSCPLCRGSLSSSSAAASSSQEPRPTFSVDAELERFCIACLGKEAYYERELDTSGPNLSRRVRAYRRKLDRLTDGSDVACAGLGLGAFAGAMTAWGSSTAVYMTTFLSAHAAIAGGGLGLLVGAHGVASAAFWAAILSEEVLTNALMAGTLAGASTSAFLAGMKLAAWIDGQGRYCILQSSPPLVQGHILRSSIWILNLLDAEVAVRVFAAKPRSRRQRSRGSVIDYVAVKAGVCTESSAREYELEAQGEPIVECLIGAKEESRIELPRKAPRRLLLAMRLPGILFDRDAGFCRVRQGQRLLISEIDPAVGAVRRGAGEAQTGDAGADASAADDDPSQFAVAAPADGGGGGEAAAGAGSAEASEAFAPTEGGAIAQLSTAVASLFGVHGRRQGVRGGGQEVGEERPESSEEVSPAAGVDVHSAVATSDDGAGAAVAAGAAPGDDSSDEALPAQSSVGALFGAIAGLWGGSAEEDAGAAAGGDPPESPPSCVALAAAAAAAGPGSVSAGGADLSPAAGVGAQAEAGEALQWQRRPTLAGQRSAARSLRSDALRGRPPSGRALAAAAARPKAAPVARGAAAPSPNSGSKARLWICRHGEKEQPAQKPRDWDLVLTQNGLTDVQASAWRLAARQLAVQREPPRRVVCSPYPRCVITAGIFARVFGLSALCVEPALAEVLTPAKGARGLGGSPPRWTSEELTGQLEAAGAGHVALDTSYVPAVPMEELRVTSREADRTEVDARVARLAERVVAGAFDGDLLVTHGSPAYRLVRTLTAEQDFVEPPMGSVLELAAGPPSTEPLCPSSARRWGRLESVDVPPRGGHCPRSSSSAPQASAQRA